MGGKFIKNNVLSDEQGALDSQVEGRRAAAAEGEAADGTPLSGDPGEPLELVSPSPPPATAPTAEEVAAGTGTGTGAEAGATESGYAGDASGAIAQREAAAAAAAASVDQREKEEAIEAAGRGGTDAEREALKSDEYLASRYRFAEQCYLIYHMAELAARHQISQADPAGSGVLPHYAYKKTHLLTGKGSTILNKLRARPGSERLLDAMPAELSSLIPKIALYKVVYEGAPISVGEIVYEVPIKFLSHTLTDEYKDSMNILQPASGRTGVGIKSFDWEFIATNPDTIRNDIKAKLVLFFQSFDDLVATRTAFVKGDKRDYQYLDLIVHPKKGTTPADIEADVPDGHACDQARIDYSSSFYEIRATVGWSAETSGLSDEMRSSVAFNQTSLYLTLLDHSFNIEQDGTFTLTIEYRGRMDGMLSGPRANILLTGGGPGAFTQSSFKDLVEINAEIGELKKEGGEVCADENVLKKKIEELKEQKVKLEDSLRVLSYKRFASDLLDPSPYYKEGYPMIPEDPPRAQPLLYTVPVTRDQIAVFADRGRTYQEDILEFSDVAPASEGDVLGQMRDQIDIDSDSTTFAATALRMMMGQEFKVSGGEFESTLEDYSILEDYNPRSSTLNRESVSLVQFFFLGDLIDILAIIVLNNTKDKVIGDALEPAHTLPDGSPFSDQPVSALGRQDGLQDFADKYCFNKSEVKNTRILLGPLEYRDGKGNIIRINIGDIPISWRMFVDFCHRKIIKPRKQTYSFIAFIRDMVKDLAIRALGAECFGEQGSKGVRMRVGFLEGPAGAQYDESTGVSALVAPDPIVTKAQGQLWARRGASGDRSEEHSFSTVRLNMDTVGYDNPVFDHNQSAETKDAYQYIVIYTEGPSGLIHPSYSPITVLTGDTGAQGPVENVNPALIDRTIRGIHHLHFGRDRGLVKSIQFSKTDSPYLREARVEKVGTFDPILQLSDVYEVTIKMYGNVYFYPGSYIYINPFGMGSPRSLGFPWARGDISNIMGLGGYHIIINVSSYIEEGNYETTIKARFDCSGDGCRTTSAGRDNDTICPDQPVSTPALD